MRTEDYSKGKNVLSRAKDKLVEKVSDIRERIGSPEPLPSPGFSPVYRSLENYVVYAV